VAAATHLVVVEASDRQLSAFAREAGLEVASTLSFEKLAALEGAQRLPDVLLLDLRGQGSVPPTVASLKRRHPRVGMVIVAETLDPAMMLEAMRAGVSEFVTEPLDTSDLRSAIERVVGYQLAPPTSGRILAFVGAKGGVGTTTLAVNIATALAADKSRPILMIDLHVAAHGDASLLLGVEPKFSVVDALENTHRLDASYLKSVVVRSKFGVDVLASPERPALRQPDPDHIHRLLERVAEHYACVILDVPRADFGTIDALDPLSSIMLVVNQELPTVRRAAQVGALLRQRYGKDRVATVVSRYDPRADIGQEDIERVIGLPVWATLPSDYRKVLAAANAGQPLVSDNHSRLASTIVQLAQKLGGRAPEAVKAKPAKTGGRLGFF
jgi:pilus assembly protein CpaE